MVYNNQPANSYPLPQGPGNILSQGVPTPPPPWVSPDTPPSGGQSPTFTPIPPSGIPASSVPKEKRQPDLQRFARKEQGNLTSRFEKLQALRKQVDPQSLHSRTVEPALRMGSGRGVLARTSSFINWYRSLNNDLKIGLACICLLAVLILSVSIFGLAGGFQTSSEQNSQGTLPNNTPVASSTSAATPSGGIATPQPSSTPTPTPTQNTQPVPTPTSPQDIQPVPTPTPDLPPTPTPVPTPTPTPDIQPTPTPTPTPSLPPIPTVGPTLP